jgi:uncharacterized membrane protein YcaP (DUF421 family)
MDSIIAIIIRVSIMYIYTLAIMRLSGKRTIDNISPLDFVIAIIIGDMFDDIFWAEIPIWKGIVGITSTLLTHLLVAYVIYQSTAIRHLLEPVPTLIIEAGKLKHSGLRKERIRVDSLFSDLRQNGEDNLAEIDLAFIEPSGKFSMKKSELMKIAQKRDLEKL